MLLKELLNVIITKFRLSCFSLYTQDIIASPVSNSMV